MYCPTCRTTETRKGGLNDRGVQRYQCRNSACATNWFLAKPYTSPYTTPAAYMRAYRRRQRTPVYHRSKTVEWETPHDLFATLDAEFHFTLDVCATPQNAKCPRFYTRAQNALLQPWEGVCWCNPPYGPEIPRFIEKAAQSARDGATVVCLVPARTDTRWWHAWVAPYAETRFVAGRLKFSGAPSSAPFPNAVVIFRPPVAHDEPPDTTTPDPPAHVPEPDDYATLVALEKEIRLLTRQAQLRTRD